MKSEKIFTRRKRLSPPKGIGGAFLPPLILGSRGWGIFGRLIRWILSEISEFLSDAE